MPRFRNLKDVAFGLLGTFMSRYNEIEGYWALGVRRADHPADGASTRLLLVDRSALPATPSTYLLLDRYAQRLRTMCDKHGFAPADVTAAAIFIEFDPAIPIAAGHPVSYGDAFRCTVTITGRRAKTYTASEVGRCARHDPVRESRTGRWP